MERFSTRLWDEEAEADNPFVARSCYCAGYDVYGELLGSIRWEEYLYLLLRGEAPDTREARLLHDLAVALANPGLREYSVQAAMNAGVGGSSNAACLSAALAVGAGQLGGARDLHEAMLLWQRCGVELERWQAELASFAEAREPERTELWAPMSHPPGFDPNGVSCATPVRQGLRHMATLSGGGAPLWLQENREALEAATGMPLSMAGVAASVMHELALEPGQAEMLYLLLRLPGAAVHALEQAAYGSGKFPFFKDGLKLDNDPQRGGGER